MNAIENVIDERDAAEQAMSQAYYLVTGNSPEWSNNFGYTEALREIEECLVLLKSAAKQNQAADDSKAPNEKS